MGFAPTHSSQIMAFLGFLWTLVLFFITVKSLQNNPILILQGAANYFRQSSDKDVVF